jgi:hypothetical protein
MKIYFLENQYPYWGWHQVLLEVINGLKNKYKIELVHQKGGHLRIEKFNHNLSDCELLIHDEENDILKAIHWGESRSPLLDLFINRNKETDTILITQYYNIFHKDFDRSIYNFKIKNTTYYTFNPKCNYDYYYHQRKLLEEIKPDNFIDEMFFLFTTIRPLGLQLREAGIVSKEAPLLCIEDYCQMAINYKMGLAMAGVAEVNFREIEYMAIGVPLIRMEYMTQLDPPLIPNYHYIAVDRKNFPWDMYCDRNGGLEYVEAYKKRFYEVKDDKEFLSFVAKNARDYYVEYCSPINRVNHILKSLNL